MHRSKHGLGQLVVVMALLLTAASGCGGDEVGQSTPRPDDTRGKQTSGSETNESRDVPQAAGSGTTITTLEQELASKAAREQRVLDDAGALQDLLNDFWTNELSSVYGLTFDTPDAFHYYRVETPTQCGDGRMSMANNAFYCPVDGNELVEFDLEWFQRYLITYPENATTFLILAHEWGHAVQDTWTEQQPGKDTWFPGYRKELNADCLAGVFLARSIADKTIVEDPEDAEAIWGWLFENGSGVWFAPGGHGTPDQRRQAFSGGFLDDTAYCRAEY